MKPNYHKFRMECEPYLDLSNKGLKAVFNYFEDTWQDLDPLVIAYEFAEYNNLKEFNCLDNSEYTAIEDIQVQLDNDNLFHNDTIVIPIPETKRFVIRTIYKRELKDFRRKFSLYDHNFSFAGLATLYDMLGKDINLHPLDIMEKYDEVSAGEYRGFYEDNEAVSKNVPGTCHFIVQE